MRFKRRKSKLHTPNIAKLKANKTKRKKKTINFTPERLCSEKQPEIMSLSTALKPCDVPKEKMF